MRARRAQIDRLQCKETQRKNEGNGRNGKSLFPLRSPVREKFLRAIQRAILIEGRIRARSRDLRSLPFFWVAFSVIAAAPGFS